ncbi:MAG TPA: hypothetical protein VMF88_10645 [Bacteroidota bacterium]|nr:hypothetical protein [Bacteroidota bacterium]
MFTRKEWSSSLAPKNSSKHFRKILKAKKRGTRKPMSRLLLNLAPKNQQRRWVDSAICSMVTPDRNVKINVALLALACTRLFGGIPGTAETLSPRPL